MPIQDTPDQWAAAIDVTRHYEHVSNGWTLPRLLKFVGTLALAGAVIDFLVVVVAVFSASGNAGLTLLGLIGAFAGALEAAAVGLLFCAAAAAVQSLRDIREECAPASDVLHTGRHRS